MPALADLVDELLPDDLDAVLAAGLVLVEAWAPACGACHQLGQLVALAAQEFRAVDFYRINVRDPSSAAAVARLRIRVAPSAVALRDGAELGRIEERCDADALWDLLGRLTA